MCSLAADHGVEAERQVFVKTLCGGTIGTAVKGDDAIQEVKHDINMRAGIPKSMPHLTSIRRRVDNYSAIGDCNRERERET